MAVPKRKTSTSKKRMRRSHHKLSAVNITEDKKSKMRNVLNKFKNGFVK